MIESVQPPPDLWSHQWHQLQSQKNSVIERRAWLAHAEAISNQHVDPSYPDEGGFWIDGLGRSTSAKQMLAAEWRYLRPCTADDPFITWDEDNFSVPGPNEAMLAAVPRYKALIARTGQSRGEMLEAFVARLEAIVEVDTGAGLTLQWLRDELPKISVKHAARGQSRYA